MSRLVMLGFWAATLLGCTDNPSILILRNVRPGADCVVDPGNEEAQFRGILDVTSPLPDGTLNLGYVLTPAVSNPVLANMVSPTNPTNPTARTFFIRGAHVEVLAGTGTLSSQVVAALSAAGLSNRTVRIGGSIAPGGDAGLAFEVIDLEQVQVINQVLGGTELVTVVVRVKIFGERDDDDMESLPFEYPITVCRGCLIVDAGMCSAIDPMASLPAGGICNLLQDENLACCTLASGMAQCPAKPPTM
jgi:hypothetical protein